MRRWAVGAFALLTIGAVAWAADNYPIGTFGGTRTVLKTTDTAGVHTPHVIVDSGSTSAVTVADGADVTQGTTTDAACATDNGTCTVVALLKRIAQRITTAIAGTAVTQSGTWTVQPGNTANTTPWLAKLNDGTNSFVLDPCQSVAKTSVPISQAANTQLIAGTSAKKTYICSILTIGADAENLSLVAGTGSVCATGTAAVIGGTTAAAGPNFAANGGFSLGNGLGTVASGLTNADNVCLFQSGSGRVAGVLTYVQQ